MNQSPIELTRLTALKKEKGVEIDVLERNLSSHAPKVLDQRKCRSLVHMTESFELVLFQLLSLTIVEVPCDTSNCAYT